jgi:succinyl-CoA synthetase alpha subunit
MENDYELFDRNTQAILYGKQVKAAQRMLDFDHVCGREIPSVACFVNPTGDGYVNLFFGKDEVMVPVYKDLKTAISKHNKASVVINFSSFRSAYRTTIEAIEEDSIRTVVMIAEGVPERRAREIVALSKKNNTVVIGPATVGGLVAGAFKIGNTGGTIENIIESKLYRSGSVGLVSKSGGMSNELFNIISKNTDGVFEGIAIGGDLYPGSTFIDHLLRFEKNPKIKMMVCLGEVGGEDEYNIINAVKEGKIKKPVVMWVMGTCAKLFPTEVQFGHAAAKANNARETADSKNKSLREIGITVPNSFDDFGMKINECFESLKKDGKIPDRSNDDLEESVRKKADSEKNRKPSGLICSISDDRGNEVKYNGTPLSKILGSGKGIGDVIGLLWFKRELPAYASTFLENVIMITADHGPSVSGAHNTIISSRAGKDLVSSLCSGMLTIGPRFGGAISGAANYFGKAKDNGMSPKEFVDDMKNKNIRIPGIGHRVKSVQNPDKRVEMLKDYVKKNFKSSEYLDYAIEVERITVSKKNNLILNVDGCIGVCFLDLMKNCGFSKDEVDDILGSEALNGLFVLGRSIGMIGHAIDQKRLKQPLYRHPWDDTMFIGKE